MWDRRGGWVMEGFSWTCIINGSEPDEWGETCFCRRKVTFVMRGSENERILGEEVG